MKNKHQTPWYKNSIIWGLIAIPSSAVIMGITMIVLAISSDDGLVVDDYYKQGKEINRRLIRDKQAKEYSLRAQLYWIDNHTINVKFYANNKNAYLDKKITLYLRHPTREGFDIGVELKAIGDALYEAKIIKRLKQGRWKVEISSDHWRLIGRLQWPDQQRLLL